MLKLKKLFKVILLLMFGTLLGLGLMEGLLRLAGFRPATYYRKFTRFHSVLGWEKVPNASGEFRKGDVVIRENMNSHGLRDDEYPYEKPPRTKRVLVIGDSFTEGYDVEFHDTFTEILQKMLNDSSADDQTYEVINAGTGGYSTDQEYLYYATEGHRYHPDMVFLMTYSANDIFYNNLSGYGNYAKPLFSVREDTLYLTNVPLPAPKQQEFIKGLLRDLVVYQVAGNIILTRFPGFTRWLNRLGFVSRSTLEATTANVSADSSKARPPSSFSVYESADDAVMTNCWNITDHLMGDMNRCAAQNGSKLVIIPVPDRLEIYPADWEATKQQFGVNETTWNIEKPSLRLAAIARRHAIALWDLPDYLRRRNAERFYNAVHWNVVGNRAVADFLFQKLRQEGFLKAP